MSYFLGCFGCCGGFVVLLLIILAIVVATRPATFRLERSATLSAPVEAVFPLVNDFHQWRQWSPWETLDPNLQRTYEGPEAGMGAIYKWSGNKKAGQGQMTLEQSNPNALIVIKLQFIKPFAATNKTTFTFTPAGDKTQVSWVMEGTNNFMAKAFHLFVNMDKMVGKDFEKGLANLDAAAQGGTKT